MEVEFEFYTRSRETSSAKKKGEIQKKKKNSENLKMMFKFFEY